MMDGRCRLETFNTVHAIQQACPLPLKPLSYEQSIWVGYGLTLYPTLTQ